MKYKNEEKYKLAIKEYINDETTTIKYLSKKYGFDKSSFSNYIKKHGITIRKTSSKEKNDKYKKAEEMYLSGISILAISKDLNINRKNLGLYLKEKGLNSNKKAVKYKYDKYYFDVIDTENKAYWLGFIYADGCVRNDDTHCLSIELSSIDIDHLNKFKNSICSDHKISVRNNRDTCVIRICNKHVIDKLISYGCVQNKTELGEINIDLDTNLVIHFIRGYMDGDGYIDKTRHRIVITIKSEIITQQIHDMILNTMYINFKIKKQDNCYRIYIENKKDYYDFLNYIYKDATIYLDRKYEIYKNRIMPS